MSHFSLEDREILEDLLQRGFSYRAIGMRLQKSHSSISDEVRKNGNDRRKYNAISAHKRYLFLKKQRRKRSKLEISPGLKLFIVCKILCEQWSPEQIDHFLRIKSGGKCVLSHESIYRFIYSPEGKKLKLYQHLRRKKYPHRQSFGSRKRRHIIPQRVSIHRRHKKINERSEFGHWETDLMIFSQQKFVMAVSVERMSRYTVASILPNKSAIEMKHALSRVILDSGQLNVRSITFDNGTENVLHHELLEEFPGLETFFCDPYCSWQKGTVENTNGLLRQYFPRNINLGSFSQQDIDKTTHKLNNRPRKCLHFSTPFIAFHHLSQFGRFNTS
jgi:IS30 family transposase